MADNSSPPAPDSARSSGNLVSSDKYNGKAVYGAEDKKVGAIECVMVDKSTGEPAYLAHQTVEHQKTAQPLAWEIGQGEDADLQRFASETLPTVLEHLRAARDLAAQIPVDVSQSNQKR